MNSSNENVLMGTAVSLGSISAAHLGLAHPPPSPYPLRGLSNGSFPKQQLEIEPTVSLAQWHVHYF